MTTPKDVRIAELQRELAELQAQEALRTGAAGELPHAPVPIIPGVGAPVSSAAPPVSAEDTNPSPVEALAAMDVDPTPASAPAMASVPSINIVASTDSAVDVGRTSVDRSPRRSLEPLIPGPVSALSVDGGHTSPSNPSTPPTTGSDLAIVPEEEEEEEEEEEDDMADAEQRNKRKRPAATVPSSSSSEECEFPASVPPFHSALNTRPAAVPLVGVMNEAIQNNNRLQTGEHGACIGRGTQKLTHLHRYSCIPLPGGR